MQLDEDEDDEINKKINFQHVKSRLSVVGFNAKEDLPILVKPFQFQRFGFKNKKDCKLLCKKTKALVKKYPKKRKKSKKKLAQKEENTHSSGRFHSRHTTTSISVSLVLANVHWLNKLLYRIIQHRVYTHMCVHI